MNSKPVVIPDEKPFPVKYSLYMKIIDSIPEGKLSTLEAIDDFLSDLYNESFIERPLADPCTRFHETLSGQLHARWRIVLPRGLIQDWRLPIGMEERRLRLEAEGHSVTPARSGVSYQVANYLDHMFDLNLLRDEMPLKQDAAIIRMI